MGFASIDLAIMADRVREMRTDNRRDRVSQSARHAYTRRDTSNHTHGAAAARALRGLVEASLHRNDR